MKKIRPVRILSVLPIPLIVFISLILLSNIHTAHAQNESINADAPIDAIMDTVVEAENSAEIEKIEERQVETKEAIKQKEEEIEEVKKEAEKIIEEKKVIEREATIKEKAAEVVKEELKTVVKEAAVTNDPQAKAKAQELSQKAVKLEKEAEVAKEKLTVAKEKASLAETTITQNQEEIESLRKAFESLRLEKAAKRTLTEKLIRSAIIIVICLLLLLIGNKLIKGFGKMLTPKDVIREDARTLRIKTIVILFDWLFDILVVLYMLYLLLDTFGINMAPLIAGAGIIGLALGFGGQYLIRDLINGLFILIEGQYRVNDVVKINEYGGLVEDINLRITSLRDMEGRVIIIPNGEIKIVVNFTKTYSHALFDIGVAYKENVDHVMQVIKDLGADIRKDEYYGKLILGDLEMFGVDSFGDSAVNIKFRIKTLPIKQWEIAREFRRRLKNKFDELGIEIPFPHQTHYIGSGDDNKWLKDYLGKFSDSKG